MYCDRLDRKVGEAESGEDKNAADRKACGELLVRTYMEQAATSVEPAAVELGAK